MCMSMWWVRMDVRCWRVDRRVRVGSTVVCALILRLWIEGSFTPILRRRVLYDFLIRQYCPVVYVHSRIGVTRQDRARPATRYRAAHATRAAVATPGEPAGAVSARTRPTARVLGRGATVATVFKNCTVYRTEPADTRDAHSVSCASCLFLLILRISDFISG